MGKAVKRGLTLLLAALLAVCALFPSVALEGESAGLENEPPEAASEGAGTEEPSENPGEGDPAEGDTRTKVGSRKRPKIRLKNRPKRKDRLKM